MAKLFYTLEEAAQKLRKSTDEVMGMARAGQLVELRDRICRDLGWQPIGHRFQIFAIAPIEHT